MALSGLIQICKNLNTMFKNFSNIFQGIFGLLRIILIPLWNVFKILLWSMNTVDYYCTRIRVLSDEYLILRALSFVVNGLYNFIQWIIGILASLLFITHDYDRDELIPPRQRAPATKNVKITRERIDSLIRSRKRDTEHYRRGYPGMLDDPRYSQNVRFHKNEISSMPDGDFIDNIHTKWWGDYTKLEIHHGYIQWLFPIRESGMNFQARELQSVEAKTIQTSPECKKRVLQSYKMMLDFYGLRMVDEETGAIERAHHWQKRFTHLNKSFHNYLRITRILKSLGELGFEKFKFQFVEVILEEIILKGTLPNCFDSCVGFWIMVLRNDEEREKAIEMAKRYCDIYNGVIAENNESGAKVTDENLLENSPQSDSSEVAK